MTNTVHENTTHIYGKKSIEYAKDELIVVCLLKNGSQYIDEFIKFLRVGDQTVPVIKK